VPLHRSHKASVLPRSGEFSGKRAGTWVWRRPRRGVQAAALRPRTGKRSRSGQPRRGVQSCLCTAAARRPRCRGRESSAEKRERAFGSDTGRAEGPSKRLPLRPRARSYVASVVGAGDRGAVSSRASAPQLQGGRTAEVGRVSGKPGGHGPDVGHAEAQQAAAPSPAHRQVW
jgi:hypothetical protein